MVLVYECIGITDVAYGPANIVDIVDRWSVHAGGLYCSCDLCCLLQRKDLLQLMIDATDETNQNRLHTGEIVADAVGFMFAGHETTSITLVFATYVLGAHPEVQEKLANEIHDYFEENPVRGSV